jgi:hypothetical protein
MSFSVGDVVRVREDDLLRGGQTAKVMQVLPPSPEHGLIREYVVEFQSPPQQKLSSDRFLFCIYREEELSRQEGLWQGCT